MSTEDYVAHSRVESEHISRQEVLDLTGINEVTLFTMLNALRTEHVALNELYLKERKAWSSYEPNYLGSEQGSLLDNQCYQLTYVIEQLSKILNRRRKR